VPDSCRNLLGETNEPDYDFNSHRESLGLRSTPNAFGKPSEFNKNQRAFSNFSGQLEGLEEKKFDVDDDYRRTMIENEGGVGKLNSQSEIRVDDDGQDGVHSSFAASR
jgi:hypothetical protein